MLMYCMYFLRPGYLDKVWIFLKDIVPEFKLPNETTPELKNPPSDMKAKETKGPELKNEIPVASKQAEKAEKIGRGRKLQTQ